MKRIICLIICLSLLLCGCTTAEFTDPGTFYYYRTETGYNNEDGVLAPELRELTGIRNDLGAMMELYCGGPLEPGLQNPLPSDTELLSFRMDGNALTLCFNSAPAQLSGIELTVAAGCLARTFLPLTGAETLIITADGALLDGEPSLTLTMEDLSLRDDSLDLLYAEFPLYYVSPDRKYLIRETVTAHHTEPEELAMHLLDQLSKPPAGKGLRSALPVGTNFLSVTIDDGLCTVDVNDQFLNRRYFSLPAQCLSLLSVVNTLTAIDEIDRVEFTVEGNILIRYGSLSIPGPLVRDERCIGPIRTSLGEQEATLYLVHSSDGQLIPIPARLRPGISTPLADLVVRQLLADTGENGIRSYIPGGTRLLDLTINDGLCVVDLSGEYLSQPENLLYSGRVLAASLCALEDIDAVQILVNGTVPAEFDGELFGILVPEQDWFL